MLHAYYISLSNYNDFKLISGADSTSVNTGNQNGAIAQLEMLMGIVLYWIICMLHFLELPLRWLLERWDGEAKDPITTSGPLGDEIKNLQKNMKNFVKTDRSAFKNVALPDFDEILFQNSDLRKFYLLVKMVITGVPDKRLLNMRLPAIHR